MQDQNFFKNYNSSDIVNYSHKEKAFIEKEKPSGRLFNHCAAGNLLFIYPYEMMNFSDLKNPDRLTRAGCIFRNNFAQSLI